MAAQSCDGLLLPAKAPQHVPSGVSTQHGQRPFWHHHPAHQPPTGSGIFWDDSGSSTSPHRGFSRTCGSVRPRGHHCRGVRVYPDWLSGSLWGTCFPPSTRRRVFPKLNALHSRKVFPAVLPFLFLCPFFPCCTYRASLENSFLPPSLPCFFSKPKLSSRPSAQPSTFSLPRLRHYFPLLKANLEKYDNTPALHPLLVIRDVSGGSDRGQGLCLDVRGSLALRMLSWIPGNENTTHLQ